MRRTHTRTLWLVGVTCLAAVVLGPLVWIADLLGLRFAWLSVRTAFRLMLGGFVLANTVALFHVVCFSRFPKREKWRWIHVMMLPLRMFAAFDYLIGRDRHAWTARSLTVAAADERRGQCELVATFMSAARG